MKKFILLSIILVFSLLSKAENKDPKIQLSFVQLTSCYSSFYYGGHLVELYIVFEGDRCGNRPSQAAAVYVDGDLIEDGDCTDFAVDLGCPANCI